jgi:hypothetical protein
MPSKFLAYTITSSLEDTSFPANSPAVRIGAGRDETYLRPAAQQVNSYWIVILNAKNPRERVKEWVFQDNLKVPAGIDTYMNDPDYIFVVTTQKLITYQVPQGDFYKFLAKYGASRELQKLEQLNSTLGYGTYGLVSYILTGACGPRTPIAPPSYEVGSYTNYPALLMMSLESMPNGGPPWSISDTYTFIT